jgi:phosphoglycerate kinase
MLNLNILKNSIVLVRVNYDLPSPTDTDRIKDSLNTIKILLENHNKVVLITHWGRPNGKVVPDLSTKNMINLLYEQFKSSEHSKLKNCEIEYLDQYESFATTSENIKNYPKKPDQSIVFLLENTRFHPMEQSKSTVDRLNLAKQYAVLAEDFVDEAFAVSHRREATNCEIKQLLPYTFGLAFESEVNNLTKIKEHPEKPFYIVMAGSKLETKLPLITALVDKADKLFLGGMLCFTFLKAQSILYPDQPVADIYDSKVELDFVEQAKILLTKYPSKIILPQDFVYEENDGKKFAMDIGHQTIAKYTLELGDAHTIFWNGTLGYYEKSPYDEGTLQVAENVSQLNHTFKVIGGGDTNSALPVEILEKFDFVSMGGGATLDFLSQANISDKLI